METPSASHSRTRSCISSLGLCRLVPSPSRHRKGLESGQDREAGRAHYQSRVFPQRQCINPCASRKDPEVRSCCRTCRLITDKALVSASSVLSFGVPSVSFGLQKFDAEHQQIAFCAQRAPFEPLLWRGFLASLRPLVRRWPGLCGLSLTSTAQLLI